MKVEDFSFNIVNSPDKANNKKANLILALSLVLGGMTGIFFALIRSAVRQGKLTQAI